MSKEENNKKWDKFRSSGLLWFINTILHVFGWAIKVIVDDDNNVIGAYPDRVPFRGFDPESNDRGYAKVTKYMNENSKELLKEVEEGLDKD